MKNEAWSLVPAPALTLSTQPWETESFHIRRCTTFNKVIIPCYSQGLFSICPQWEQNIEQTNKRRRNEKGRNLWCTSKPTFHIGVRRLSEKLMLSNSKLQSQLNKRSHIQAWRHTLTNFNIHLGTFSASATLIQLPLCELTTWHVLIH